MKCSIPEIAWHNRDPVLSVDFQPSQTQKDFIRLATGGCDTHVVVSYHLLSLLVTYLTGYTMPNKWLQAKPSHPGRFATRVGGYFTYLLWMLFKSCCVFCLFKFWHTKYLISAKGYIKTYVKNLRQRYRCSHVYFMNVSIQAFMLFTFLCHQPVHSRHCVMNWVNYFFLSRYIKFLDT